MSKIITLRKGLDINLLGKAQESLSDAPTAAEYALSPLDFEGVTPKLLVKVGDEVKAGTPLFFNKYNERILFTSPVSGKVAAVNRGEKRRILTVTVTPDAVQRYEEFAKPDLQKATREQIVELCDEEELFEEERAEESDVHRDRRIREHGLQGLEKKHGGRAEEVLLHARENGGDE